MRRATVTIPPDLEEQLDEFIAGQDAPPSLASVVQTALRRMLGRTEGDVGTVLLLRVLRNRSSIKQIARRHGATSIALFGSVARGEERPSSDLDFLVDMESGRSLFDLARLRGDLEELFAAPVDVVSKGGLDQNLAQELAEEAIIL